MLRHVRVHAGLLDANMSVQTLTIRGKLRWDTNLDGTIDRIEFRRAIDTLGYAAPVKEVDALFDS